jgi:hypothetical protein
MAMNDLRIAEDKPKAVLLKTHKRAKSVFFEVGEFRIYPSPAVNYLGVNIGQRISFKEHVKSVVNKARKTSRAISMLLPNVRGPATNKRKVLYGVSPKKRRGHSSLIYRRILIIYTPNEMVVNRLQNGLINSRIAPRASRLNWQNTVESRYSEHTI